MNVVRELRNTITHLQAELERKDQTFTKARQDYQHIIDSLQTENTRLKSLLAGDSFAEDQLTHPHDDFSSLATENTMLRN